MWTWLRTAYQNRKHDPPPGHQIMWREYERMSIQRHPQRSDCRVAPEAARVLSGTSSGDRAALAADGEADRIGQEIGR